MAGVQGVTNEVGSRPGTEDRELGGHGVEQAHPWDGENGGRGKSGRL